MTKRRSILAVVASACALGIAVPVAISLASDDEAGSVGPLDRTHVSVLDRLDGSEPLPADLAQAVERTLAMTGVDLDYDRAGVVADTNGISLVLAPSRTSNARFCAVAVNRKVPDAPRSFACSTPKSTSHGLSIIEAQTEEGGIEASRVYFGVVPDGIVSVMNRDDVSTVDNNVFSFSRSNGEPLGVVRYIDVDGAAEDIRVTE